MGRAGGGAAETVRRMRAERRLRAQVRLASAHKESALCEVGLDGCFSGGQAVLADDVSIRIIGHQQL